jgi:hypothetical protein
MSYQLPRLFMVFDVESIGLHGEAFAVGYVVIDRHTGEETKSGMFACSPEMAEGEDADREWVKANVPRIERTHNHPSELCAEFWNVWAEQKAKGAVLVSDCAWPVEANFLTQCVELGWPESKWEGPYPLIDVSSILLACGRDPVGSYWMPEDGPKHNPLADARQSARMLGECFMQLVLHEAKT